MNTNNLTCGRLACANRLSALWRIAVATAAVSLVAAGAFAAPNDGQGPITIGGGVIGPELPPGFPCEPPQLPPTVLLPSYARGRLRETCGGVLRPIANKPIEVILRVRQQPFYCDVNNIPPSYAYNTTVANGTTDADGAFDVEFWATDAGVSPNDWLVELKVRIVVYDDTGTVPIWETAYYPEYLDQEFEVYEDIIFCVTEGTRIRVTRPNGDGAYNAEVFVDGLLYPQRTNANGFLTINPPLPTGANIVARAMVHESASERGAHDQGSTQNWKYRAYNTSMPLQYDSNGDNPMFSPVVVDDPNGAYQLNLRRDAAYIGLHLVASIEWDASPMEFSSFESRMIQASDYLFNATDGQMLIERVDVYDDKINWNEADFRLYADLSLRAHVDWPSGGFWNAHDASFWRSNWIHMSRSNDHPVYIHEFGHYGMRLKDEYDDDDDTHCAHGVGGSNPVFDSGGGKASCMMFNQWSFTKICSAHPDNPHLTGTRQGDEDCWSEIKRHFTAEAPGPNGAPRWIIRTPADRGVIVNALCCVPLTGWDVLVEAHDANNVNLCRPVQFQWASNNGFADGASVFSRNSDGRTIIQGTSDAMGIIKPFQGSVRNVAGLHIGDTVGAMWTIYANGQFFQFSKTRTFTDADCQNAMVVLSVVPGAEPPAPLEQLVEGELLPFSLAAQLEPGAALGEAIVRVRGGAELGAAPIVRLSVDNETTVREISMASDAATGDWIGSVTGLAEQFAVVADVEATDETGAKAAIVTSATFTGSVPDEDSELVSSDGVVELEIPAGALAGPTQIAIGGSVAPLPNDFPGRIVTGPIALTTNGAQLSMPATLRFRLPFDSEEQLLAATDPAFLIVLAFDESTGMWSELDSRFRHGELAVESEIAEFGPFVLLERGAAGSRTDPNDSAADGTPSDNARQTDPAGSADCGTGTCGGGMAPVSPLMLGLIGLRRLRLTSGRRNRRRP